MDNETMLHRMYRSHKSESLVTINIESVYHYKTENKSVGQ